MPCKWKPLWTAAKGENTWLIIAEVPLHVRGKHMISDPSHTGATHIHQRCCTSKQWKQGQNLGGFSNQNSDHNWICSSMAKTVNTFHQSDPKYFDFSLGLFAHIKIKKLFFFHWITEFLWFKGISGDCHIQPPCWSTVSQIARSARLPRTVSIWDWISWRIELHSFTQQPVPAPVFDHCYRLMFNICV